jgi:hypothetical protein
VAPSTLWRGFALRTDLKVPYAERLEAKRLGARWDRAKKTWFIVDKENLEPFLRWMPLHLIRAHTK